MSRFSGDLIVDVAIFVSQKIEKHEGDPSEYLWEEKHMQIHAKPDVLKSVYCNTSVLEHMILDAINSAIRQIGEARGSA